MAPLACLPLSFSLLTATALGDAANLNATPGQPATTTTSAPEGQPTMSAETKPQAGPSGPQTPQQTFDPKVRRIGVQILDEAPPTPEPQGPDQATPDKTPPILPYTVPNNPKLVTGADLACQRSVANCEPRPTFKLGAQLLLLPIRDSGMGANKNVKSSRILQRARVSATGRWRSLGVHADLQDVRRWGQDDHPAAVSSLVNLSLYQGYLELVGENKARGYHSFFRAGRQAIVWGEQRLLGYGRWTIHGRSHDAVRALVNIKKSEVDLFWSVRRPSPDPQGAGTDSGAHLGGVRFGSTHLGALSAEVHGLWHLDDQNDTSLGNVGARLYGDPNPALHYSFEGNFQFGKREALTHQAWALAGWASYQHRLSGELALNFKIGATAASGNKADGKSREFFNFYPANHRNYGLMDLIGWRNMMDYEAQAQIALAEHFNLGAAYHFLGLVSKQGAWRDTGGAIMAAGDPDSALGSALGSELDFLANYKPLKALHLQLGYGLWIPTQDAYRRLAVPQADRRVQQRVFLLVNAQL